jgi:hypothetical protein
MERSKGKVWVEMVACDLQGLEKFDASNLLRGIGFAEGEVWEIISVHDAGDGFVSGTSEELFKTITSVLGTTVRVDKKFEEHCKCKVLDVNGKCTAFCFHNRLKSPGVMIDCIGIETSPVVISGHIAGSTRL